MIKKQIKNKNELTERYENTDKKFEQDHYARAEKGTCKIEHNSTRLIERIVFSG